MFVAVHLLRMRAIGSSDKAYELLKSGKWCDVRGEARSAGVSSSSYSLETCQSACSNQATCNYLSFDASNGFCAMYSICGTPTSTPNAEHQPTIGWSTYRKTNQAKQMFAVASTRALVASLQMPAWHSPAYVCAQPLPGIYQEGLEAVWQPWWDDAGFLSPHLSVEQLLTMPTALGYDGIAASRTVVNLGAFTGTCGEGTFVYDPANCLVIHHNFSGVLVEGDPNRFKQLENTFRMRPDVVLRQQFVTGENVADLVSQGLSGLGEVHLLKVDVDNCDLELVEALLQRGLRPRLIHVEYFMDVPPPFLTHCKGPHKKCCKIQSSLSSFLAATRPFGFELLRVDAGNAVLMRSDIAWRVATASWRELSAEQKWLEGWFCRPWIGSFVRMTENTQMRAALEFFDPRRLAGSVDTLQDRLQLLNHYLRKAMVQEAGTTVSASIDKLDPHDKQSESAAAM